MANASIATIRINGGRLCLDFVNTATWPPGDRQPRPQPQRPPKPQPPLQHDFVSCFADLLTWGHRQGLLTVDEAASLTTQTDAADALQAVGMARELRLALRQMFEPDGHTGERMTALKLINRHLANSPLAPSLEPAGENWRISPGAGTLGWLTAPIFISALDLAASSDRQKIGTCPGTDCGWLFLDVSPNGTRRWCSMASCGNRAKTRTNYQARRASRST